MPPVATLNANPNTWFGPYYPTPRVDRKLFFRRHFGIPDIFWASMRRKACGYFCCQDLYANDEQVGHVTMLKSLALEVDDHTQAPPNGSERRKRFGYKWLPLELVVRWDKNSKTMLAIVFQACTTLKDRIETITLEESSPTFQNSPFGLHIFLLEELLDLYDKSFWRLRHNLQQVESSYRPGSVPKPDYPLTHDLARHMIHHSESIEIAIDTIEMLKECHQACFGHDKTTRNSNGINEHVFQEHTKFLRHVDKLLHQFRERSRTLNERLRNEINLSFNSVVQYDSRAMRTISILTLVFLPGTFISGILGTNFFSVLSSGKFSYAVEFWYIWLVPFAGLTLLVLFIWWKWDTWTRKLYKIRADRLNRLQHV
ncbi:hypothetical protein IQ07DRAFT_599452 [Pyrenochaeta sp. DS3sAY3a]|nr:hypothetical protein IQ07DRAFT_599452 [Pyrenochaeta sp. DS3sAY3a]